MFDLLVTPSPSSKSTTCFCVSFLVRPCYLYPWQMTISVFDILIKTCYWSFPLVMSFFKRNVNHVYCPFSITLEGDEWTQRIEIWCYCAAQGSSLYHHIDAGAFIGSLNISQSTPLLTPAAPSSFSSLSPSLTTLSPWLYPAKNTPHNPNIIVNIIIIWLSANCHLSGLHQPPPRKLTPTRRSTIAM